MISRRQIMEGILPPQGITETVYGDTDTIVRVIRKAERHNQKDTAAIAHRLKGKTDRQTAKNVFRFVRQNVRYKADGWHQKIMSPSVTLIRGKADCKSMTNLASSLLKNLRIGHKLRLAEYAGDGDWKHIYLVADIDGQPFPIDTTLSYGFGYEEPYKSKKDMDAKISYIHGIEEKPAPTAPKSNAGNWIAAAVLAFLVFNN